MPILLPDQLDIAGELRRRCRRPARCSARPASSCSTTRPAWCGWPRTCCTSTATSRAASARRAAKAPTGCYKILQRDRARRRADEGSRPAARASPNNIAGKTLCAFGDAAATPVLTTLKHFRHEYEAHIREGRCTLPADWRARQPVGGALMDASTDAALRRPARPHRSSSFFMLLNAAAVLVLRRAQGRGLLQQRLGPYLVGPHGLLQPLADIIKLMFKEELRPKARRPAPLRARADHLGDRGVRRVRRRAVRRRDDVLRPARRSRCSCRSPTSTSRVLVVFAIASMGVYGIVLAGWSSNSKYSLLGGLRSSAQMISYELSYGMALAARVCSPARCRCARSSTRRRAPGSGSSRAGSCSCSRSASSSS